MKILSIEDSQDLQLLYRTVIEGSGHQCLCAETAGEARELLKAHGQELGLILMDLTLPDLPTEDFADYFGQIPGFDRIPLIVSSGRDDVSEWSEKLGALQAWKKPVEIRLLRGLLKELSPGPGVEPTL